MHRVLAVKHGMTWSGFMVRSVCVIAHMVLKKYRLVWYQLRAFIWFRAAPWSTSIYGRIGFAHLPCRINIGKNCSLGDRLYLSTGRSGVIDIGNNVSINTGGLLVASERITIGDNTAIGEYVSIRDQVHKFAVGHGIHGQGYRISPVDIGCNVWIGRGVFIGPGSRISSNSIVAANSVVHGEFPPNVLLARAPAKIKKNLADATPQEGEH